MRRTQRPLRLVSVQCDKWSSRIAHTALKPGMEGEGAQKGPSLGGEGGGRGGAAVILITGLSEVYQPSCGDIGRWRPRSFSYRLL